MTTIEQILKLAVYMLGVFTAALIFMFVASILLITTYLAIMIGKELYQTYIKNIFKAVRERLTK